MQSIFSKLKNSKCRCWGREGDKRKAGHWFPEDLGVQALEVGLFCKQQGTTTCF